MLRLLMTSALAVPLLALPVHAQDTPPPAGEEAPQTAPMPEDGVADPPAGEGEPTVIMEEPAEGEAPEMTQEPAEPPAEDGTTTTFGDPGEGETTTTVEEPAGAEVPATAEEGGPTPEALVTEQAASEIRGDWIMGTTVTSPQGESIGPVQDLIIDPDEGQITAAILGVGGFLGLGAKNIAVDWNELQIDADGQAISLDITREEAEAAPEYTFRERDPGTTGQPAGEPGMAPEDGAMPPAGGTMDDPAMPPAGGAMDDPAMGPADGTTDPAAPPPAN